MCTVCVGWMRRKLKLQKRTGVVGDQLVLKQELGLQAALALGHDVQGRLDARKREGRLEESRRASSSS